MWWSSTSEPRRVVCCIRGPQSLIVGENVEKSAEVTASYPTVIESFSTEDRRGNDLPCALTAMMARDVKYAGLCGCILGPSHDERAATDSP